MNVLKSVPVMAAAGAVAAQAAYSSSKKYRLAVGNDRTTAALYGAAGGAILSVVASYALPIPAGDGLGMHPQHHQHPLNNGHPAMHYGLGDTHTNPPWYKNPLWIVAGVGLLIAKTM